MSKDYNWPEREEFDRGLDHLLDRLTAKGVIRQNANCETRETERVAIAFRQIGFVLADAETRAEFLNPPKADDIENQNAEFLECQVEFRRAAAEAAAAAAAAKAVAAAAAAEAAAAEAAAAEAAAAAKPVAAAAAERARSVNPTQSDES